MEDTTKYCNAKKRQGDGRCRKSAGWGVEGMSEGPCRLHGGAAAKANIKTGIYSKFASSKLAGRMDQIREAQSDLSDLGDDILLARAVIADQLEGRDTLDSEQADQLFSLLDRLSRLVARHDKIQHGERFTITVDVVEQYIETVKKTIREEFARANSASDLIGRITDHLKAKGL